jgi:hypothetical protein
VSCKKILFTLIKERFFAISAPISDIHEIRIEEDLFRYASKPDT